MRRRKFWQGQSKRAPQSPRSYRKAEEPRIRHTQTIPYEGKSSGALRRQKKLRERLEVENTLLLEEIIPRIIAATQNKSFTVSGSSHIESLVVSSSHVNVTTNQTIDDVCSMHALVDEISSRQSDIALRDDQQFVKLH